MSVSVPSRITRLICRSVSHTPLLCASVVSISCSCVGSSCFGLQSLCGRSGTLSTWKAGDEMAVTRNADDRAEPIANDAFDELSSQRERSGAPFLCRFGTTGLFGSERCRTSASFAEYLAPSLMRKQKGSLIARNVCDWLSLLPSSPIHHKPASLHLLFRCLLLRLPHQLALAQGAVVSLLPRGGAY